MAFNSYFFILCFLPITIFVYFLLGIFQKREVNKLFLVAASFFFIGYADLYTLLFVIASMVVTYCMAALAKRDGAVGKIFLTIGIIANLCSLFYVKYSNFVIDNFNKHLGTDMRMLKILVPLGISFTCFQQIMYLVDVYKGEIKDNSLLDYCLYVTFFPKFIQGPITDYHTLMDSFADSDKKKDILRPDSANIAEGLWLFSIGLAKKVLIADVLSKAVSYGFNNFAGASSLELLISTFCYTFQIYFDFSGYSGMAIGIAKMLNISLGDNFNCPYQSLSITDFWKRWHISLTNFLRKYIYFPLGGSRKGVVRTYVNIMIIFLISGIWHGANWTFIFWGLLHGALQCLERLLGKQWEKLNVCLRWIINFSLINIAWTFFRAESVTQAFTILKRILQMESTELSGDFLTCFEIPELSIITARVASFADVLAQHRGYGLIAYMGFCLIAVLAVKEKEPFRPGILKAVISAVLLFFSIISLSTVVEFIYGGF